MSLLSSVISSNSLAKFPSSTVGVFVGATSGIGEHTAYAFAKYVPNPTIYIIGRNEDAGNKIVDKLKEINANSKAKFLKHDLTLVKEAEKLSNQMLEAEDKVNVLFLSCGTMSMKGRTETPEGIDAKLAVNYYSRWRIVEKLLPLLKTASEQDEISRVVTVLEPGHECAPELNNLDLIHNYTLRNVHNHMVEYNSLAVMRFARLYPQISFIHASPGIVRTNLGRELPWYLRSMTGILTAFATTPEVSGQKFFNLAAVNERFDTGAFLVDKDFNSLKEKSESKGFLTAELQDAVWNHTEERWNQALN